MKKGLTPGLMFAAALALAATPALAQENRMVRPDVGDGEAAVARRTRTSSRPRKHRPASS